MIVVQESDKRGGHTKRFDLRVVSGRTFQFECRNTEECDEWVKHIEVSVIFTRFGMGISVQHVVC